MDQHRAFSVVCLELLLLGASTAIGSYAMLAIGIGPGTTAVRYAGSVGILVVAVVVLTRSYRCRE